MHVFNKIEEILKIKKMSWYQLALLIGESEQRLHNIKRRKSKVDFELMCKIATALDIDLNKFYK